MNITMIHSRKLSAKAVLTLTVRAESRVDAQLPRTSRRMMRGCKS